jgi:DinB family protein
MSDPVVEALVKLFRELHERLRDQVRDLDAGTLNWRPLPKANSIAVLVTHMMGAEIDVIRNVRSVPNTRDREAEFRVESDAAKLLELIDTADREVEQQLGALTSEELAAMVERGQRGTRPGIEWVLFNYGHSREHLAHIELTKQLYDSRT